MIYYTADSHIGHANIIRHCDRPFETVEAMDAALVQAWNARVTGNDTIYIIGDLLFRHREPEQIIRQLHGKKHLIIGNHDSNWMHKVDVNRYFHSVNLMLEFSDGRQPVTLCHYPLVSFNHARTGFMIHGHIHQKTDADYWPLLCARDNVLNAGVDINHFEPVTFEELLENNRHWKALHPA